MEPVAVKTVSNFTVSVFMYNLALGLVMNESFLQENKKRQEANDNRQKMSVLFML